QSATLVRAAVSAASGGWRPTCSRDLLERGGRRWWSPSLGPGFCRLPLTRGGEGPYDPEESQKSHTDLIQFGSLGDFEPRQDRPSTRFTPAPTRCSAEPSSRRAAACSTWMARFSAPTAFRSLRRIG